MDETSGSAARWRAKGSAVGAPASELLDLAARVAEARRRLGAGDLPPLEELERSLSAALARQPVSPVPDGYDQLTALQDEIEALLAVATEGHQRARHRLEELAARGRACRAYRRRE